MSRNEGGDSCVESANTIPPAMSFLARSLSMTLESLVGCEGGEKEKEKENENENEKESENEKEKKKEEEKEDEGEKEKEKEKENKEEKDNKIDVQCLLDQVTVNKYIPGRGIGQHIDTHSAFGPAIISVSLGTMGDFFSFLLLLFSYSPSLSGSGCVMVFQHGITGEIKAVHLPRRSAVFITGEARYAWLHGIKFRLARKKKGKRKRKRKRKKKRKRRRRRRRLFQQKIKTQKTKKKNLSRTYDIVEGEKYQRGTRTSITYRSILTSPCDCSFPLLCDSRQGKNKKKTESQERYEQRISVGGEALALGVGEGERKVEGSGS